MTDTHLMQALQVQLGQANDARGVEHDLRIKAERRAAQYRASLFEMAQRLLPNELDELWKTTDVNVLPDDQLARWLLLKLDKYLFDYRAMTSGRDAEQLTKLQTSLNEHVELIQQRDRQIDQLNVQLKQIVVLKDQIGELHIALDQVQQEKMELAGDLEVSRVMVARLRQQIAAFQSPTVSDTALVSTSARLVVQDTAPPLESSDVDSSVVTIVVPSVEPVVSSLASFDLVTYPAPSDRMPEWYGAWLTATKPEDRDRQSAALYALGQGQAFIRAEVLEYLNSVSLASETDPDKPSGLAGRIFRGLTDSGFVDEIDGGFGAAVPAMLCLSQKGCVAYEILFGDPLQETLYERLFKRHKTPEHTVLNVLARRVLLRFGFKPVDLFPDRVRLTSGLLADPDIVAISPEGEKLYVECERGHLVRADEERAAKWNRMIELGSGRLYIFVPNKTTRGNLLSELSSWIYSDLAQVWRAELFFCEYTKALQAPAVWTHTTNIYK